MFPTIPWTEVAVNGALADTLVTDFGRAVMGTVPDLIPPEDWVLCLKSLEYGAVASVAVEIYFSEVAAATADFRKQVVNDTLQFFIWPSIEVPRSTDGRPWAMYITKAATNANIGFRYRWQPPGC